MLTRRCFLAGGAAFALHRYPAFAQGQLPAGHAPPQVQAPPQTQALVQQFLQAYDVPGLSLAYGRGTRILLAQAFGTANRKGHQPVTTESLFRIASLSKSITSAAIFTLVDAGKLSTGDLVFGKTGILRNVDVPSGTLQQITVRHLLTHTAGGWGNQESDPMFHNHDRDRNAFLQHTVEDYPLRNAPGTTYAYSNFGYFLLGRIVEHVSGQPYAAYVQQHVLHPLGITDMQLGSNKPAPNEVHYYGDGPADPYEVPIELHDANGGWLATPTDLVHFALGVFSATDKAGAPALFAAPTLAQLLQPTAANPHYACGWGLSPEGDATHTGSLPGTTTVLMHRHDGLAWSLLTNTRRGHTAMEDDLRKLGWNLARSLPDA